EITDRRTTAAALAAALAEAGVLVLALDPFRLRAVTHYPLTGDDIDRALAVAGKVL
ncbi:MAG: low specificity L-threonine aldolase, partial [Deltaproteobacteria bacterium]|nr:low specificity L-threonine aldolase [Deltaproteobacteria bacterium]